MVEELPSKDTKDVYYRFTVSDTGIGMAEETLAHLFEPFVRSRAVSRIEGSGLGLSIVKGLVDLMRGKITVHSELKKGTTFLVELKGEIIPADERRVAPVQQTMDKMDATLFAGRCFLVAEDNQVNAEIICEILRMSGAEVVVRGDGALTVEAYRSTAPGTYDAILMDIQMPEMDGYEAAKTIRADSRPDAKDIPIIAMTANAFEQDVVAALAVGMNAHLAKPIEPEKLFSTLHDYL
ncbi:response regulator [Emergencia timonensis]|uniref:ATP-binding response regulator n=1 Tax=Emergencia timonensis TaxID=1776384 RepID=UPI00295B05ED|nr:response regulator [Emergencia timonensis]WNX90548.1 response regulator [Emergencia timonensis]